MQIPRRAPIAAALALMLALAGGCTGGEDSDEPGEAGTGGATETAAPAPPVETKVTFGQVVGRLKPKRKPALRRQVTAVVDDWLDRAYVAGDYPRTDFDGAFRAFTRDAAALAERQRGLLTNAAIGDRVDAVRAKRRAVVLDVLAVKGRPKGVTARVHLVFETSGEVERTEAVRARLALTPTPKGWQVFAFDVRRGELVPRGGKRDGDRRAGKQADGKQADGKRSDGKRDGNRDGKRDGKRGER